MRTEEAVKRYLAKCKELGKSENTIRQYQGYLSHFVEECPDLPLYTSTVELYLKRRKETPARRGMHFKTLQGFYKYLEQHEGITSPIPAGVRGRRRKVVTLRRPSEQFSPGGVGPDTVGKRVITDQGEIPLVPINTMDAIDRYIQFKIAEGASARTQEQYRWRLFPFAKAFPVLPLYPDEVASFLSSLKVDPITRWDYRKHLISFYHYLEKRKEIPIITPLFPKVKVPKKVRRVLSGDELAKLFGAVQNLQEFAWLTLLIDSKIRATELCTLTRENVFPDHITVIGKVGERDVPISQDTYNLISQLADSGYLFTVEGRVMNRAYLRVHLRELMLRAGLTGKKLGPHILRHSSSVQHVMHGGDITSLKEELGHQKIETTAIYAHLAFKEVKQQHGEADVLGHITRQGELVRALCFSCNLEIRVKLEDVTKTECMRCHQVGKWYLPEVKPEEMSEVKHGVQR